ncbi:hypothetical protein BHE74_00045700 [Ensete ventricosum]|nr:hypothetical protein GW17_00055256 [Ensete ventricosum]RWW48232.1 hypothetical protein BHE74_00045700 [Ensete ventricosum]RZS29248.1 hypothetical protein BHM03_00062957 [Ensete ventricosum]
MRASRPQLSTPTGDMATGGRHRYCTWPPGSQAAALASALGSKRSPLLAIALAVGDYSLRPCALAKGLAVSDRPCQ